MGSGIGRPVRNGNRCHQVSVRNHSRTLCSDFADDRKIQVNRLDDSRGQQIERARVSVRVERFHVHDALVFRGCKLWKMRMDQRCLACMQMHVEQGSVKRRYQQRGYRAARNDWSHERILMKNWV